MSEDYSTGMRGFMKRWRQRKLAASEAEKKKKKKKPQSIAGAARGAADAIKEREKRMRDI